MKKILILLIILISLKGWSQIKSEEFFSSALQDNRKLAIYVPDGYDKKNKYPLIVVLDAEYLLEPVIATARYYTYFENMPPSIIVGVYNTKDDISVDREYGLPVDQTLNFMSFLGEELVSYMEKSYKLSSLKMIIGEGKAANYMNYFLLRQKPAYNAYVSLNPDLIQKISANVADNFSTAPYPIFYYLGSTDMMYQEAYDIVKEFDKLVGQKEKEKVRYTYEDFVGASENSVALTGIPRAFDLIFDVYKPISVKEFREVIMQKEGGMFDYLTEKYGKVESQLGVEKNVGMNDIMAIYSAIMKKGDWNSLYQLANFIKDGYKDTAMPDFFLGEYYERGGEPKKALRAYQRAYAKESIDFMTKDLALDRINKLKSDFGLR